MKLVKPFVALAGVVAALTMSSCSLVHHHDQPQYIQTYDVVCDPHEYLIHDYHCGYMDHQHWVYFGWVHPGVVSRAPSSWTPPASVKSRYATKQVPNPKYTPKKSSPKKTVNNTNVNKSKSKTTQNKSVTKTRTNPGYKPPAKTK